MNIQTPSKHNQTFLILFAWLAMAVASLLPTILLIELGGGLPVWFMWGQVGVLLGLALAAQAWAKLRPLRNFMLILAGILLTGYAAGKVSSLPFWQSIFQQAGRGFALDMAGIQLEKLIATLLMIGLLLVLGYRRKDFFLTPGDLRAPIKPVRWLGFPKVEPWTHFGGQYAIYLGLGILVFLILGGQPTWAGVKATLPLLPIILLLAALNAFSEEVTYRGSMLAGLEGVVGPQQALWNSALYFGIAHYYGVPYGILGVAMSTFMGWFLGKAMLETRGLFWSWLIHWVQDILIFFFIAMGSITPGG